MTARRRRQRRRQQTAARMTALRLLVLAVVVMLVVALSGVAVAAAAVRTWLQDLPDPNAPGAFEVAEATRVYSADGKLIARLYLENRTVIPISKISSDLANAVVAIEDERFYMHKGVDFIGLARAVVVNLQQGFGEEGASTITQQYIRNTILLDERTEISIARKIREAYLAMELEKRYNKQQILEMYLNAIYFGEGSYGAEAASRTYFSKHASELTLAQAALLAGLPQQPGRLNPYENPDGAVARRNVILQRMLKNGYIDQERYLSASQEPLKLKRAKEPEDGIYSAHYFVAHVKKVLQAKFSPAVVFEGGLKVYTTLDSKRQEAAEDAVKRRLPAGPEAALVSVDPRHRHLVALVGGRDFHKNKFNLATQGHRQAGSAFKTFTLVTALNEGMPPSYLINSSSPALIPTKPTPWRVSNSEGSGKGAMPLDRATAFSVNTVFARLAFGLGAKKIVRICEKMGIETKLNAYPSIALGAQNVTPLEMASAYGTLANNGKHYEPVFVTKVVDKNGETIYKNKPKGKQAIKPSIAYAATNILRGVVRFGTGTRANIGRPIAGKTGTSQSHRDVWFVGYTPQLSTAVWVGHRQEKMIYVNGMRAFGGTVCAPIWGEYMRKAMKGVKVEDFKRQDAPKYNSSKFRKKIPGGTVEKDEKDKDKGGTPAPTTPDPDDGDNGGGDPGDGDGGGGDPGDGDDGGGGGGDGSGETSGTP